MTTQAQINDALATIRGAQIETEGEIALKLSDVVDLIDTGAGLYPGGLPKTLSDLRNVADQIGKMLTPAA